MKVGRCLGLVGCIVLSLTVLGCGKEEVTAVHVGGQVPRFTLKDCAGGVVSTESLQGQIVLLTFWSTTCGPCVREIPDLQALDDNGSVKVVAVALNPEGWSSVTPFVEKHQVHYRIVLGDEGLFDRCGGYSLPHSLLIDWTQRVVKIYRGAITREMVERDIEFLKKTS
jgi:peroxiredoxin